MSGPMRIQFQVFSIQRTTYHQLQGSDNNQSRWAVPKIESHPTMLVTATKDKTAGENLDLKIGRTLSSHL